MNGHANGNGNGKRNGIETAAAQLLQIVAAVDALRRRAEYSVLSTLHEYGTLIVGDVQRRTCLRPAQLSRTIGRLQGPGRMLISAAFHAGDRRKVDLSLTPAGAAALSESPLVQLLRRLPENEQATLCRLLTKLHAMSKG